MAFAAPPGGRADATAWDDGLLGADGCRVCHQRQYDDWGATAHARAFDVLPQASRTDARCLGCHSTGDGAHERGVQCESCHGPGADYWPSFVMRDKELARAIGLRAAGSPEVCGRCHTPEVPSLVPFLFKDALPRVNHSRSGGES